MNQQNYFDFTLPRFRLPQNLNQMTMKIEEGLTIGLDGTVVSDIDLIVSLLLNNIPKWLKMDSEDYFELEEDEKLLILKSHVKELVNFIDDTNPDKTDFFLKNFHKIAVEVIDNF